MVIMMGQTIRHSYKDSMMSFIFRLSLLIFLALSLSTAYANEDPISKDSVKRPVSIQSVAVNGRIAREPGSKVRPWDPYTTVSVNSLDITTFVNSKGEFTLHGIPPGSHIIQINSFLYNFPYIRIDVSTDGSIIPTLYFEGSDLSNLGPDLLSAPSIEIFPTSSRNFFLQRQGLNILDIFKNPMMLMSIASLVMVIVGPKLLANMPTEFDADGNPIEKQKEDKIAGRDSARLAIKNSASEPKLKPEVTK